MSAVVRSGRAARTDACSEQPQRDSCQTAMGDGGGRTENYQGGGENSKTKSLFFFLSHIQQSKSAVVFAN